jgi:hypothetical protein
LQLLVPSPCVPRSGIPGAGNCGSLSKDTLPPAVAFELQGQLHGHAEALPPSGGGAQPMKDVEASAGELGPVQQRDAARLLVVHKA